MGSFFTGFIYNNAVSTGNKRFSYCRGVMTGLIAGAFSWGSLPFIFPIRAIPASAPPETFFTVVYIMAALIAGVSVVAALLMNDPPAGWKPAGLGPQDQGDRAPLAAQLQRGRGAQDLADVDADRLLHPDF